MERLDLLLSQAPATEGRARNAPADASARWRM